MTFINMGNMFDLNQIYLFLVYEISNDVNHVNRTSN